MNGEKLANVVSRVPASRFGGRNPYRPTDTTRENPLNALFPLPGSPAATVLVSTLVSASGNDVIAVARTSDREQEEKWEKLLDPLHALSAEEHGLFCSNKLQTQDQRMQFLTHVLDSLSSTYQVPGIAPPVSVDFLMRLRECDALVSFLVDIQNNLYALLKRSVRQRAGRGRIFEIMPRVLFAPFLFDGDLKRRH